MKSQKSKKIFLLLSTTLAASSLISVPAVAASCAYKGNDLSTYHKNFKDALDYSKSLNDTQKDKLIALQQVLEDASRLALNQSSTQVDVDLAVEMILNGLNKAKISIPNNNKNESENDNIKPKVENDADKPKVENDADKPKIENNNQTIDQDQNALNDFVNSIKTSIQIKSDDANKANLKLALDSHKNISFDKTTKMLVTKNDQNTNDINLQNTNWPEDIELISTTTEDNILSLNNSNGKVVLSFRVLKNINNNKVISNQIYTIELGEYSQLSNTTQPDVNNSNLLEIYFKDKTITSDKLKLTYLIKEVHMLTNNGIKLELNDGFVTTYMSTDEASVQENDHYLFSTNLMSKQKFETNITPQKDHLKSNFISADAHLQYDEKTNKVLWGNNILREAKYIGEFTSKSHNGSVKYYLIPNDLVELLNNNTSDATK
ncbi:hypothetical protein [Mycoplasma miroungirhinis]|uniref:Uncharacterized protein n=1 Tax=Mycoplasma miroungirhinis TaxID=754516 RepID=A0A6M4JDF3_9MOLU|nr:hypothetical protein [Mycoplasma miroungirhinis]QJR44117.1 hypothetical protein HLA92_01555 [Mycoplasma miroungirhinis]